MRKIVLIFSLFISMTVNLFSQDSIPARYFPLKIGNAWNFDVWRYPEAQWYRTKFVITKDTLIDNVKYFYFDGFPPDDYYLRTSWIRFDSLSSIIRLIIVGKSEFDYVNLSAIPGDTLIFPCITRADTSIFGVNTVHKFYHKNINSFHLSITRSLDLAYMLGITYYRYIKSRPGEYIDVTCNLRGCTINGIVYGDTTSILGINNIPNITPNNFSLSQNYPNPFNPVTKIQFALPKSTFAKVIVYDVLGRELETLVNEQLSAGTYEVDWSADKFSSGIYYYKLTAGDYSETRKMVLIK